jgi:TRAP-type transport system periplasmic protein
MHCVQGCRPVSVGSRQRLPAPGGAGSMSRRAVLAAGAGLAIPFLPRFARAAEFTWRIAHNSPPDFAIHGRLMEAASVVATQSEGRMSVEISPNSEMGSAAGLLAQVRAGTVDGVSLSCQSLSRDLAVAALPMTGFAFSGYDQLWPALDGDVGRLIRGQLNERLGLVAMEKCWDFGFRQVTTSRKPVNVAADMAGLRLRTQPEADFVGLFQALKALPVPMPLSTLTRALAAGGLDGQESVLALVRALDLAREQSVCALTSHIWDGLWLCVSGKSWSKLPDRLKDIAGSALNDAASHQRQDTAQADIMIRHELEAAGMKFNTVDVRGFRAMLRKAGYYSSWNTKMGDDGWAALEKYAGGLT